MKNYTVHTVVVRGSICTTTEYYARYYPLTGYNKTSKLFSTYTDADQWGKKQCYSKQDIG